MQSRVIGDHTYHTVKVDYYTIGLIKLIKGATFKFENQKYLQSAVYSAKRKFQFFFQTRDMACERYLENFNNIVSVVEQYEGHLNNEPILIEEYITKIDETLTMAPIIDTQLLVATRCTSYLKM